MHAHAYTHTHTHANTHTHTHTHTQKNTHKHTQTHTHTQANTHTHTRKHTHTYTRIHTHTHTPTHTHAHTHLLVQLSKAKQHVSTSLRSKAKTADLKLVFIPLIFLILRVWDISLSFPLLYLPYGTRLSFRATLANAVLVLFAVSTRRGQGSGVKGQYSEGLDKIRARVV